MRQFQFEYSDKTMLLRELQKINNWCRSHVYSHVVFYIFSETTDQTTIEEICRTIDEEMPYATYMGCSSNGNVLDGKLSPNPIGISCTIFEYASTKVKMLQYKLTNDTYLTAVNELKKEIETFGETKAIEMLLTIRGMSMTNFCKELSTIPENIEIFGGGAFNLNIDSNVACVFTKEKGYSNNSIAFLLMGGNDFYIDTRYITGWKPLGRPLRVTRSKGSTLYELDGRPAYETYYKYLNIKNDENFFTNTLEFPFLYRYNGIDILRAPIASNDDGSLEMTSDIEENVLAKIAYGDPWTILENIESESEKIRYFSPEIIHIYSCAARRTFWGNHESQNETQPLHAVAPTFGFFTSSEFLRTNGAVNQHNVTLVIASMREGEPFETERWADSYVPKTISGKISMVNRLATFIAAATDELDKANKQLELLARTDSLTQILNRGAIQSVISENLNNIGDTPLSLIMVDIDNFKRVNDIFGHNEGDNVIKALANILSRTAESISGKAYAGRWGGEEFMFAMVSNEDLLETAEKIRNEFSKINFDLAGNLTVSVGITVAKPGESVDTLYNRVDDALYTAKETGKNKTVRK
ncbi:MAG: GGDEF domain-containing protein [Firmicutes bacterium]|nr:GGDEF domain-containing protein [Bacillota bacterium]